MKYPLVIVALCVLAACNRPECKNTDPLLERYSPESREYKKELLQQIAKADASSLHYWIEHYYRDTATGQEYMYVYVQGGNICARAPFNISNTDRLKEYRLLKGRSYHGAELSKLKYKVDSTGGRYELVIEDVEKIID